jgi:16S rRNA (uracil1498-N3)-methyltransferase
MPALRHNSDVKFKVGFMRRRFFVEKFENQRAILSGETAEHLGRVLRAETGQLYELSDGANVWLARIEAVALPKRGESRIDFALVEPIAAAELSLRLSLLISLIKFDRFEWCLEKATELGVAEILPLAAARSDKPLIDAAAKRRARWERILIESAQQSRRLRPPILHDAVRPAEAFAHSHVGCKIVLSERPEAPPLKASLGTERGELSAAALAIGPEGGWIDDELALAGRAGFVEASLGETILRTETAVIAAAAVMCFALI